MNPSPLSSALRVARRKAVTQVATHTGFPLSDLVQGFLVARLLRKFSQKQGWRGRLSRPVGMGGYGSIPASQGTLGSAPFPSLCPSSSWYSAASLHALQSQPLPLLSGPMSTLGEDAIGPTPSCSGCPLCIKPVTCQTL